MLTYYWEYSLIKKSCKYKLTAFLSMSMFTHGLTTSKPHRSGFVIFVLVVLSLYIVHCTHQQMIYGHEWLNVTNLLTWKSDHLHQITNG